MPVPSSINDLSTTAGSNSPGGSETPGDGDNYLRAHAAFIASLRDKLNGTSDTGTVKSATFSGTMAGAASWAGLQTFAAGLKTGNTASSDPAVLDFYLEGTFTPVVSGVTTAGSATYSAQSGRFTRVGNLVFVEIDLFWSGHTGAGVLSVSGLPYAPASNTYLFGSFGRTVNLSAPAYLPVLASQTSGAVETFDESFFSYQTAAVVATGSLRVSGHYRI